MVDEDVRRRCESSRRAREQREDPAERREERRKARHPELQGKKRVPRWCRIETKWKQSGGRDLQDSFRDPEAGRLHDGLAEDLASSRVGQRKI